MSLAAGVFHFNNAKNTYHTLENLGKTSYLRCYHKKTVYVSNNKTCEKFSTYIVLHIRRALVIHMKRIEKNCLNLALVAP